MAADAWQRQVQDDQVRPLRIDGSKRRETVASLVHTEAFPRQNSREDAAHVVIVFDE